MAGAEMRPSTTLRPVPSAGAGAGAAVRTRRRVRGLLLQADNFPPGTPLRHFFAWNEKRRRPDPRFVIARDLYHLITACGRDQDALGTAVGHLSGCPVIVARRGHDLLIGDGPPPMAAASIPGADNPASQAARDVVTQLLAAVGASDAAAHAGFFAALDRLAEVVDLHALARRRPRLSPSRRRPPPRRILVIRLSALGDFVQALGPAAAIRRHHAGDHLSLLTTAALAPFAARLGLFDQILVDQRPAPLDFAGWLALRRQLRRGSFDRVYDLQTQERTAAYARLFLPAPIPEWSGTVRGCSHPHANLDRDRQHTIDKQAEQLMMAGIYPIPLPSLPPLACELPAELALRPFALLMPGSSPRHPAKRWPAARFGVLAKALTQGGLGVAVIGAGDERQLAAAIREICPSAVDLVGRTDLATVGALAQRAALTVGNDTGVPHLAAAAGSPVVVLFSSATAPDWCAPRGRKVRVLAVPDLADDLTAEAVIAAARETLGATMVAAGTGG